MTQALEVAVIERAGSELDSGPDLTRSDNLLGLFFLTKNCEHENSEAVKHWEICKFMCCKYTVWQVDTAVRADLIR